jgi:hypothetical protein
MRFNRLSQKKHKSHGAIVRHTSREMIRIRAIFEAGTISLKWKLAYRATQFSGQFCSQPFSSSSSSSSRPLKKAQCSGAKVQWAIGQAMRLASHA